MSYLLFVNLLKPTKYLHIVKHPYHSFLFAVAFIVFMYCVVKAIPKTFGYLYRLKVFQQCLKDVSVCLLLPQDLSTLDYYIVSPSMCTAV